MTKKPNVNKSLDLYLLSLPHSNRNGFHRFLKRQITALPYNNETMHTIFKLVFHLQHHTFLKYFSYKMSDLTGKHVVAV